LILIRFVQIVNRLRLPVTNDSLHNLSNDLFNFITGRDSHFNTQWGRKVTSLSSQNADLSAKLQRVSSDHADELQSLSIERTRQANQFQRVLKQRDELSKQLRDLSTNHDEQLQSLSNNHADERAELLEQSESRRAKLKQARDQIDQLSTEHREAGKRIQDLELQLSADALQLSTSSAALRQSQQELDSVRAQNQRLLAAAPRPS
jgi:chromosome segregation ATPase